MTRTGRPPQRGQVHPPVVDPDTPGVCLTCRRPLDATNDRHGTPPPVPDEITQAEARRLGERKD